MIIVLGGSGYVGGAFAAELRRRGRDFRVIARRELDYTRFDRLVELLRTAKPDFLINAAGYTGKPNVDACELHKADTLLGNVLLPRVVAQACEASGVPWGHVSSGCIYSGAKLSGPDGWRTVKDLSQGEGHQLAETRPELIRGFTEEDAPNFCFRDEPCSIYSGSKALGEEVIAGGRCYLWRLRIPFDEVDNRRNYLSKIQNYPKVYENVNSISHRLDFVRACLDLWQLQAPFGIYNVTNPGFITTRQVIRRMVEILKPERTFEFWANDEEFYRLAAKTPRSNCVLDVTKLLNAGVKIRPVWEALEDSLRHWQPLKS